MKHAPPEVSQQPELHQSVAIEVRTYQAAQLLLDGKVIATTAVESTHEPCDPRKLPSGTYATLVDRGLRELDNDLADTRDRENVLSWSNILIGGMAIAGAGIMEASDSANNQSSVGIVILGLTGVAVLVSGIRSGYKTLRNKSKSTKELRHKFDVLSAEKL